jgi:hypothetical protein
MRGIGERQNGVITLKTEDGRVSRFSQPPGTSLKDALQGEEILDTPVPCPACRGDLQHGVYCPVCKMLRAPRH